MIEIGIDKSSCNLSVPFYISESFKNKTVLLIKAIKIGNNALITSQQKAEKSILH